MSESTAPFAVKSAAASRWHRPTEWDIPARTVWSLACGKFPRDMTLRAGVDNIPSESRCRTCWPTTKDVTP